MRSIAGRKLFGTEQLAGTQRQLRLVAHFQLAATQGLIEIEGQVGTTHRPAIVQFGYIQQKGLIAPPRYLQGSLTLGQQFVAAIRQTGRCRRRRASSST